MIKRVLSKLRRVTMSLFAVLCAGAVWGEEEATTPSTSALTIDPSAGYVLTGLGELGDQAAVVFTNSAAAANWTVPKNLKDVEILVVGGGGGGGGHYYNSTAKNCQGGAGGGGGAVVTGFIKDLAADQVVNVTVGAGGTGGAAVTSGTTAGSGKATNGGNTVLKVGDLTYVTAYGGGGDGGKDSGGVANGGSNSGARKDKTAAALKSVTVVGEGAEDLVSDIVSHVNKGGGGYSTSSGYPGAGGGGAGSAGGASGGSSLGGTCGYGYVSMITDVRMVYGAGGGGGVGKNGGTGTYVEDDFMPFIEGAGLGVAGQPGSDALANQGGGGGGGSWKKKGGNGGSGIVVLRFAYSDVDIPVDATENIISKISDKPYTGSVLASGLEDTYAYTIEELGERINFGQQTVRVTLNEGYVWADGDENRSKDFTWNITQEVNDWKVEPYLSHTAWPQVFAGTVNFKFTAPETSFGVLQAELSANGAAPQVFDGVLPTEAGSYTLRYWVEETANWAAKEWVVNFKIFRSEAFESGYKVYGLGENGDEVAVVFTQSGTWNAPASIKSAQFLVVGGGGGGGADVYDDAAAGGAGGGGGGVVVGEVDIAKNADVAVTVGAGGAGGQLATDQKDGASSGYYYGASRKGGDSVLKVGGTTYVTAYGGGRDQGTTKRNSSSLTTSNMREGGQGGSNAGSRGGITAAQSKDPQMGAVASNAALRNCTTYGNKGGKGCSTYFYGYPSAGGGGGATEAGGDAGDDAAGWPGGKGGQGLASEITGARVVYGSGGGGSSTQGGLGGKGGDGAGDGGDREGAQGTAALANQGGGGGGSSREITYGGAGGSGIVVIRYTVYPAEVNDVPYASFAEAFAAAQDGDTVNIYQDVKLSEILVINKAITLDGNGCTLTSTAARAINVSGVDGVTIKNLTISASGERAINVIQGATNVTIENVTATAYNYTVNIASSAANAVVAINNSTLNGLCTVNVAAAGAKVTIDGSTVNCNDNNTNVGESYAALCLGKEAVGASIVATNTVVNVTEGSDSVKARNGAENGTITIDDSTDNVTEAVAVISYVGQNFYHSFNTLEDAIGFAKDADTITILKDIATDVAFTVAKKVTIDLNGKTIATTENDKVGDGVFCVVAGGELTINDSVGTGTVNGVGGNAYNIAIWANGGKVVINGGTYTNVGAKDDGPDGAHFDLIYVKNGGSVVINGGTFKAETPAWTLNSHDTAKGTIVVNGGFFYQFNPGDCATEGAGTNWCADGLRGVESAEKPGYYTVEEYSWVAPMPEKDGDAGFTAEYTAEVLAALEANAATSVAVKVNGDALKGDAAVNALNTAVKCFEGALVFDGTAADLDIVIEVVEVNVENPAASKVVVKRGETVLAVKTGVTPTVKYVDLGSDAVTFKIVFE